MVSTMNDPLPCPPAVRLLSNGHYNVLVTAAGSGYSVFDGMDVTRWREDATCDSWGQYCYVRDLEESRVWSAGRQPIGGEADEYEADLRLDRAVICRRDGDIETCYELAVVNDANAEVRRVTLTNRGNRLRTLDVTSYAEVALNPRRADQAHPAFAKLFLETEHLLPDAALLCRRRPQARDQQPVWAVHVLAGAEESSSVQPGDFEFETDRARFLGRGRSARNPVALETRAPLSSTVGPVLDPIFSLRRRVRLSPGASTVLAFTTAIPRNRDEALALAARFRSIGEVDRAFDEAASSVAARLVELKLTPDDAELFQRLAAHVVFTNPSLRSRESVAGNKLGQPGLWPQAISGDLPIVLLRISSEKGLPLMRQVLQAHRYWRWCGLVADLVVLNGAAGDGLRGALEALVQSGLAELINKPGGIFLRNAADLSAEENMLFEAAARVILRDSDGTLIERLSCPETVGTVKSIGSDILRAPLRSGAGDVPEPITEPRLFDNGMGGFTRDGREYVISLRGSERPPAPWTNVLANPDFGCLVTEAGGGYTWAGNSQMNRLTPWSNDPVSDPPGEIVYLRDEETREFWTPTPAPCGGEAATVVRHGQGYSRFTRTSYGLEQDLLVLISPAEPVKLFHLRLKNTGERPRRLSATFYVEWVVGIQRDQAPLQVVCTVDPRVGYVVCHQRMGWRVRGSRCFRRREPPSTLIRDQSRRISWPRGNNGGSGGHVPGAAVRSRRRTRRPMRCDHD